ncbi:IclR family transcriptional regulator [Pseudonocardia alni]|uniref:IclR family transcriptional regulator n=1 Tax=Pseudonocardia alni TaxID=33907 RepID=UPI0033E014D7
MLQTVQKIGPVLDLFTLERPEWGVSEVAEQIGVPRSSAHALLASLVEIGLLQCRTRGRYRIGWRVVEMNETLRGSVDVRSTAAPVLQDLVDRYGETTHLAVMERWKVLYIDKVPGNHVINVVGARVGAQLDPHCSAVGKMLLAYREPEEVRRVLGEKPLRRLTPSTITNPVALAQELASIRSAGCSFDAGEAVSEVHCVAAPVRDDMGSVVAAVSVTVPVSRFVQQRNELRKAVVGAAADISRRLSGTSVPELALVRDDLTGLPSRQSVAAG